MPQREPKPVSTPQPRLECPHDSRLLQGDHGVRCSNVFPNGLMVGQAHAEVAAVSALRGRCGQALSESHIKDGQFVAAPVKDCNCGVHALKSAAVAEHRLIDELDSQMGFGFGIRFSFGGYEPPAGRVWGAVKLWGRLIEHSHGYRAEFAYPAALYCQDEKLAAVVAALYGVPCEIKTLAMPASQNVTTCRWYQNFQPLTYQPFGRVYSYATYTVPASPSVQQPGLIQSPRLAGITSLGASAWQKEQSAKPSVKASNRREVMKKAFGVKVPLLAGEGPVNDKVENISRRPQSAGDRIRLARSRGYTT